MDLDPIVRNLGRAKQKELIISEVDNQKIRILHHYEKFDMEFLQ